MGHYVMFCFVSLFAFVVVVFCFVLFGCDF